MTRTRPTSVTKLAPKWGTSSGINPGEDFEEPQDISDVVGLDTQIPRGSRTPTGGLLPGKPVARSPVGLEVGKSAGGGLGIGVSIPIGGPISARGGVNIGAGGAIKGAQVGLGVGLGPIGASVDVGTDQDESGQGGCYQYVTVTVGPFSHTYGRNVCEPKAKEPLAPLPTTPTNPKQVLPGNRYCSTGFFHLGVYRQPNLISAKEEIDLQILQWRSATLNPNLYSNPEGVPVDDFNRFRMQDPTYAKNAYGNRELIVTPIIEKQNRYYCNWYFKNNNGSVVSYSHLHPGILIDRCYYIDIYNPVDEPINLANYNSHTINRLGFRGSPYNHHWEIVELPPTPPCPIGKPLPDPTATPIFLPLYSPLPPNSPPKKMDNNNCCKALMLMMLMQHKHLGVTPIPGMEQLDALAGVKAKGEKFETEQMAFPFEVPKVWLDPTAKPQDRLPVRNVSELLFIMASQSERLEHVLGTKEFLKDSQGQLRGSEIGTIKWLTQRVTGISGNDFTYPDPNDFWFNTDDGIINEKKVEVRSVADAIRYLVESQNRLERILPVAEIKNSTIPARWVYPGKKGQLRVGNLIHLVEYMFRADDRARGFWPQTVKIKDANPAIKGDQKIELKFESQADMLREILKFLIDTEGDGDISNNFALRSAIHNCQQHQLLVQNNAMLDAIVEYMDFKIDRTKTKVPMPFSPFAGHEPNLFDKLLTKLGFGNKQIPGSIDKNTEEAVEALFEGVLQNTEVEVPIIKANEKKSMSESFLEILKHASAASAAVSERVGEGALKRLVDSAGIAQAVSRFLLKRDIAESNGVGDLDQWINSAEAGYTDKPESSSLRFPESDPLQPYDRPIVENPRIREIDTKDPKAD